MENRMPENQFEIELSLLKKGVLLIYGHIDEKLCEKFIGGLHFLESIGSPPVEIRINTKGGSTECTCTMHDSLKLYQGETIGIVIGKAHSGGSMILQACKIRKITKNSNLLIHYGSERLDREVLTNKTKRKKVLKDLSKVATQTEDFFLVKCKLNRKKIRKLLEKDCVISPKKALKYGLVDEIV